MHQPGVELVLNELKEIQVVKGCIRMSPVSEELHGIVHFSKVSFRWAPREYHSRALETIIKWNPTEGL